MLDTIDYGVENGPDLNFPVIEFTALDRCDACGAQAYAAASRSDAFSELLFCLHHLREHKDSLLENDWFITANEEGIANLTRNRLIDAEA